VCRLLGLGVHRREELRHEGVGRRLHRRLLVVEQLVAVLLDEAGAVVPASRERERGADEAPLCVCACGGGGGTATAGATPRGEAPRAELDDDSNEAVARDDARVVVDAEVELGAGGHREQPVLAVAAGELREERRVGAARDDDLLS